LNSPTNDIASFPASRQELAPEAGAVPSAEDRWFSTGEWVEAFVSVLSQYQSDTDCAGPLRSRIAALRRQITFLRRDVAEKEIERLESMRDALPGWDGYNAQAPNSLTIDAAAEALRFLAQTGLPIPIATMSPNGNACLFIDAQGVYADIEFHADRRVTWLLQLPGGPEIEDIERVDEASMPSRLLAILSHAPGRT